MADAKPAVILVIGDSISSGYGLADADGWVALLSKRLQQSHPSWRVENASITGETTRGGLQRLPALLDRLQPSVLIIELGGNDGLRGFNTKQTRNNLQQMITLSQERHAKVLLLGVRIPLNYGKKYRQDFEQIFIDLTHETKVSSIPRFMQGVADDLAMMQADGIHPSAAAQVKLLDNLWPDLNTLISTHSALEKP